MSEDIFYQIIASSLNLNFANIKNVCELLDAGSSIPFIARYRKEASGSMDEVVITTIQTMLQQLRDLEKRRAFILESIEATGNMTDELRDTINKATKIEELEDLYLPYKPKKKTRASVAREKGLEPLAKIIMSQNSNVDVNNIAQRYINEEKGVLDTAEAISGASDIIAEWINEHAYTRSRIRKLFENEAHISAKVIKDKEEDGILYKQYFQYDEAIKRAPSHRILAVFRGENDKFLRVSVEPDKDKSIEIINKIFVKNDSSSAEVVAAAVKDAYTRLIETSIETETRNSMKERADKAAIEVFGDNLRQLLMAPPLSNKNVLAIDPGFRTGCKVTVLDKTGQLLTNVTIYPHPPVSNIKDAINKITNLVEAYQVDAIAIGNGTAGRETENFIKRIHFNRDVIAVVVNENGASIYSASAVAREEFPDYDITVRGSVSIGRRLIDPMAELVKIDPKSIGVGQYQHDVNQVDLQKCLVRVVESCVNSVGVDVNTASKQLLTYVSGIGPALAQNIIDYRNDNGNFSSRKDLKKVKRFGDKAFEQSAGFLRIRDGVNPLDNSAVHPESYHIAEEMAADMNCKVSELISNDTIISKIDLTKYVSGNVGLPTLNDIVSELSKPGRDPRCLFDNFEFDQNVKAIEDIQEGMVLPGIVTNITSFGAFVDIGVHQDGLVHISQIADKYVSDPTTVVKLNQKVTVKVINIDVARKRISLSMKNI
ncbi:MAG: Tex family protein [Bacteroidales bacterium]|nr:Tex family protein [Bacteroidales bacterium]MDD3914336.1 Tex family protein [Bacteroidales bacterium]MDD4634115.1 Tex family protein [Bacteroidales bacterium]